LYGVEKTHDPQGLMGNDEQQDEDLDAFDRLLGNVPCQRDRADPRGEEQGEPDPGVATVATG